MRFRTSLQDDQVEQVQMAPLVDIVVVILIFFMVISAFSTLESEVDIDLPTASSALRGERAQGEIFINLRSDGSIVVNEREVSIDELHEVLKRVSTYFPGGSIIIRGDTQADLGRAIAILDICKQVDIQNVSFAAVPLEAAHPAEAAHPVGAAQPAEAAGKQ